MLRRIMVGAACLAAVSGCKPANRDLSSVRDVELSKDADTKVLYAEGGMIKVKVCTPADLEKVQKALGDGSRKPEQTITRNDCTGEDARYRPLPRAKYFAELDQLFLAESKGFERVLQSVQILEADIKAKDIRLKQIQARGGKATSIEAEIAAKKKELKALIDENAELSVIVKDINEIKAALEEGKDRSDVAFYAEDEKRQKQYKNAWEPFKRMYDLYEAERKEAAELKARILFESPANGNKGFTQALVDCEAKGGLLINRREMRLFSRFINAERCAGGNQQQQQQQQSQAQSQTKIRPSDPCRADGHWVSVLEDEVLTAEFEKGMEVPAQSEQAQAQGNAAESRFTTIEGKVAPFADVRPVVGGKKSYFRDIKNVSWHVLPAEAKLDDKWLNSRGVYYNLSKNTWGTDSIFDVKKAYICVKPAGNAGYYFRSLLAAPKEDRQRIFACRGVGPAFMTPSAHNAEIADDTGDDVVRTDRRDPSGQFQYVRIVRAASSKEAACRTYEECSGRVNEQTDETYQCQVRECDCYDFSLGEKIKCDSKAYNLQISQNACGTAK